MVYPFYNVPPILPRLAAVLFPLLAHFHPLGGTRRGDLHKSEVFLMYTFFERKYLPICDIDVLRSLGATELLYETIKEAQNHGL